VRGEERVHQIAELGERVHILPTNHESVAGVKMNYIIFFFYIANELA
jgi:hypothetical protein